MSVGRPWVARVRGAKTARNRISGRKWALAGVYAMAAVVRGATRVCEAIWQYNHVCIEHNRGCNPDPTPDGQMCTLMYRTVFRNTYVHGAILYRCEGRKGLEAPRDPNQADPLNHRPGMDATA